MIRNGNQYRGVRLFRAIQYQGFQGVTGVRGEGKLSGEGRRFWTRGRREESAVGGRAEQKVSMRWGAPCPGVATKREILETR